MVVYSKGEHKYKMTLDSFLNVVIPAAIFIFLGILVYGKAKEPIDKFFAMVRDWFKKGDDDVGGEITNEPSDYKIEYRGF